MGSRRCEASVTPLCSESDGMNAHCFVDFFFCAHLFFWAALIRARASALMTRLPLWADWVSASRLIPACKGWRRDFS
jgi:hypothetical protein